MRNQNIIWSSVSFEVLCFDPQGNDIKEMRKETLKHRSITVLSIWTAPIRAHFTPIEASSTTPGLERTICFMQRYKDTEMSCMRHIKHRGDREKGIVGVINCEGLWILMSYYD